MSNYLPACLPACLPADKPTIGDRLILVVRKRKAARLHLEIGNRRMNGNF
jgi:hypothetical protein